MVLPKPYVLTDLLPSCSISGRDSCMEKIYYEELALQLWRLGNLTSCCLQAREPGEPEAPFAPIPKAGADGINLSLRTGDGEVRCPSSVMKKPVPPYFTCGSIQTPI